ncbi:hypothetical protein BK699_09185 [Bacillus thuringiensis serovar mexicanensis]|uniref:Uncharacterized protein n=3 Tax=Bacillus TaxID=1386 RepID=A0A9X7CJN1_BACCE|nr:hypothetical protein bthur0007_55050 [Bacillus thuringiensis serovar monterrey BGSC 4AJ1]OTW50718.1 hypothetical protein BK699_09185 [Bacillus thuringiensis serovar mexicanensis]OTX09403.1 hypothetical protein BK705_04230 [Bacillus thuringiensis serovar monterrey]PGS74177.1 hypothetical protein COC69_23445 [Bacillus cereus]
MYFNTKGRFEMLMKTIFPRLLMLLFIGVVIYDIYLYPEQKLFYGVLAFFSFFFIGDIILTLFYNRLGDEKSEGEF